MVLIKCAKFDVPMAFFCIFLNFLKSPGLGSKSPGGRQWNLPVKRLDSVARLGWPLWLSLMWIVNVKIFDTGRLRVGAVLWQFQWKCSFAGAKHLFSAHIKSVVYCRLLLTVAVHFFLANVSPICIPFGIWRLVPGGKTFPRCRHVGRWSPGRCPSPFHRRPRDGSLWPPWVITIPYFSSVHLRLSLHFSRAALLLW